MPSYITATASVTDVDLVIGYNASSNGTQCETGVQRSLFVESSVICPGFHQLRYVEWEDRFDGGDPPPSRFDVRTVGAGFKPALTVLCARMRGTSDTVCWVSAARSSLECPCRQNDVEAGRQECPPHLQASFLRVQAYVWRSHFVPGDQLTCHSERSLRISRSRRCKCERDLHVLIRAKDCNQCIKEREGSRRASDFDPWFFQIIAISR